ncbi:hypothetical protein LIER_41313 [Lithospermum erythrorhizon]|uniref:Reverse transcriptase Ty1/copia-type domain-containing protein n=1 Tax=Lithospermum erythrorhizon TaxID=34254 RepID=A0AAV3RBJ3_LITER
MVLSTSTKHDWLQRVTSKRKARISMRYSAPVSKLDTVRLIISLAAQNGWKLLQMDVKSAFLNAFLQDEIYHEQPPGFVKKGEEEKVYERERPYMD